MFARPVTMGQGETVEMDIVRANETVGAIGAIFNDGIRKATPCAIDFVNNARDQLVALQAKLIPFIGEAAAQPGSTLTISTVESILAQNAVDCAAKVRSPGILQAALPLGIAIGIYAFGGYLAKAL